MAKYTSVDVHAGTKHDGYSTQDANDMDTVLSAMNTHLVLLDTPTVVAKSDDFTVTAADHGKIFYITAADKTATLPSVVDGLKFTFCVKTLGGSVGFSVSPAAADFIMGGGITDNKDLINTAATDDIGDFVTLLGDSTLGGWIIIGCRGTWAEEA